MAHSETQSTVEQLLELLDDRLRKSEWEILVELAEVDGPLTPSELADRTGYTERTIKKRIDTLEDCLHGGTILHRDEDGNPSLHPQFAEAVRTYVAN